MAIKLPLVMNEGCIEVLQSEDGIDHSQLSNLDYSSSGHIGFASSADVLAVVNDSVTNTTNAWSGSKIANLSGGLDVTDLKRSFLL